MVMTDTKRFALPATKTDDASEFAKDSDKLQSSGPQAQPTRATLASLSHASPANAVQVLSPVSANDGHTLPAARQRNLPRLSEREAQILDGLVKGHANKVIARTCDITEATVKVHMKSILRKIRVANRTQAAIWALEHGYPAEDIKPPPQTNLIANGTSMAAAD